MAYVYQRANYGDYYQAGGIFGTIGSVLGKVTKVASKVLPGPPGAIAGAIGSAIFPRQFTGPMAQQRTIPAPTGIMGPGPGTQIQTTPYLGLPVHTGAGGCASGFHLNKSDYFLKNGTFIAAGTKCVRNRKMNPGNSRALRRGVRRSEAFVGLARRALKGTGKKVVAQGYRSNWRKPLKK